MDSKVPKKKKEDQRTTDGPQQPENLLLIFTRNPELGKCKTRLAATLGDKKALEIYSFLLAHTAKITQDLKAEKRVYYSESIWQKDIWDEAIYDKKLQEGSDLGARMSKAFQCGFESGFKKIIIIGSDMYDLDTADLEKAFTALDDSDYVIGPAEDGGYYLLGMKLHTPALFKHKDWGRETVLRDSLNDLKDARTILLETKNDVDVYEDIVHIEAFQPFLKHNRS
ncbi:TIGR04282 family arsenosugar biosynthesis glycosyltransferase [Flavobacteriaceae bacterium 3-367]|uniref:TIGR04282 family arsenosugar biosynthesis glycosyltransferase n=1 Tax=Eudoraea algarum TaxID=3417568 RepID=UPI0032765504